MRGVTIIDHDEMKGTLAIDLRDILRALDTDARSSCWRLRGVEAIGAKAHELHRLCDEGQPVSGERLLALSAEVDQTIDGIFEAFRSGSESPWLRVCAIDATAFDVESDDDAILERMRRTFRTVNELPA
jgi:hypothetical protein